ncbi:MAG: hypothetical protein P4L74_02200 [Candidatus Doudnabacteria bacterium]|nr:hypothetical protein [Candidatus Doudnabacteria bacterium]
MSEFENQEHPKSNEVVELAAKTAAVWGVLAGRADVIVDAVAGTALFETFKSASLAKGEQ